MGSENTCRFAWNSSKKSSQPEYDALIESYRDMLTARAEAVLATGMTDDGPFAAFENAVLNAPPEPAVSSDQGFEQVTDAEPFYVEVPTDQFEIHFRLDDGRELPVRIKGDSIIVPAHEVQSTTQVASESPAETFEEVEAARLERAKRREAAQPPPKKEPIRKVAVAVKKSAAKPPAKKSAPKPKVIKKGKK